MTEPAIRVAIARSQPQVLLTAGLEGAVLSDRAGRAFSRLQPNQQLTVRTNAGSLQVYTPSGNSACVGCVDVKGAGSVSFNGTPLGRRVTVWAEPSGTLTVVAWIDIEEYLLGVLAGEVPYKRWAPEALKAQAIVSRSYALHQMKMRAAEPYDVETTEASQVFRMGNTGEPILQTAVNATRGQVVTCGGKLFPAYFHSTCGGATTAAERVFPDRTTAAALRGAPCAFCQHSPSYQWSWQVEKTELGRRLGLGQPVLGLEATTDPSGRAESVRVRFAGGERTFQGNQFRLAASSRELKSMWWTRVSDGGTFLRFDGRGFGHGVGMCQYGSDGMARAGHSCAEILGLYFPGADLTTLFGATTTAAR
jgi:stage II sporulation protein D